jgi:uncharacterized protein YgiM (DUF1202 family)
MRRIVLSIGLFAACLLVASPALAQTTQPAPTVVVSVDRANVRDKPTVNTAVVAALARGEELEVLGISGSWYHVRVKSSGKVGYISNLVVEVAPGSTLSTMIPGLQPVTRVRPAPVKEHPGIHAFGIVDAEAMSASKSFKAVLDSGKATLINLGFGVEGTGLWRGLFVRGAYSHSSNTGTRVFVDSSMTAHSLNIPLTIEITPIEIGAGWRFGPPPPQGKAGVRAYAGAGLLMQRYKETSTFATDSENTDTTDKGVVAFGGFEIGIKFVRIDLEGQFRSIPDVIGAGGVSLAYKETNLGGGVFRVTFGVGF